MLLFQNGGIRVTRANNIFNLIRNPDATVDDLRKLLELVPAKLQDKENDLNPLDIATNEEMVKLLTEKGLTKTNLITDVFKKDLFKAILENLKKNKSIEELKKLLKDKDLSTLSKKEQIELIKNSSNNDNKLKEIINANIDPNINIYDNTPLILYIIHNNIELLRLLLEKGANPNTYVPNDYKMILEYVLELKDINKVKLFIEKGANVKYLIRNSNPYFYYIYNMKLPLEYYQAFIDGGLDVDVPVNNIHMNMLMLAAAANNNDLFNFFLEKGADVNYKSNENKTCLMIASAMKPNLYIVEKLINKGADINSKTADGGTPLMYAVMLANSEKHVKVIKYLLEKGADKTINANNRDTAADLARINYDKHPHLYKEILELLGEPIKEEIWKGSTRSDIEKYDIFFEQPYDYSCCPICLEYLERKEGCMYMTHDCATTKHYYHKKLYNTFSYERFPGSPIRVEWCTICGRPTKEHKHYVLSAANAVSKEMAALNPEIQARLDRGDNQAFFDNANCMGFGGGGTEEKATRFRRLREYALELQEDIDKKPHNDAMKELIEEVFNAPLARSRKIKKILEDKRWNINVKEFPENKKNATKNNNNNNKNYTNIPFEGTLPTKLDSKDHDCIIMADDDEGKEENPTYHFHHSRNGGLDHDGIFICQKDLSRAIEIANKEFGDVRFGKCWFSQCQANLHPEEIKDIVPDILYEDYKKKFNKKMAKNGGASRRNNKTKKLIRKTIRNMKGGNKTQQSVLHKLDLDNAECSPPNYTKDGKLIK